MTKEESEALEKEIIKDFLDSLDSRTYIRGTHWYIPQTLKPLPIHEFYTHSCGLQSKEDFVSERADSVAKNFLR